MATHFKLGVLVLGSAALLAGCATYGPGYGYGYGNNGYDGYNGYEGYNGYAPGYYDPAYVAPSVGLGISFSDRDGGRNWRDDRGGRHEWRGNDRDGDRRDWRDNRGDRDGDNHGDRRDRDHSGG